jgi:transcriptional regulator with XRE-family HTH domain
MAGEHVPKGKHRTRPDPKAKAVGERVRQLRKEKDWTFDAFVEELGLGRGYVSELERGLLVPGLHVLHKLADALEVTVGDLVPGDSIRAEIYEATRNVPEVDLRPLLEQVRRMRPRRD